MKLNALANPTERPTRRVMLHATAAAVRGLTVNHRPLFSAPLKPYYPRGKEWETRSAIDAAREAAGIADAVPYAAEHNSTGLVILRGGRTSFDNELLGRICRAVKQ